MSEFSQSFHVPDARPDEVADIVRRAQDAGIVFLEVGRYVCCVTRGMANRAGILRFASAAGRPFLSYSYGEDHGCWVQLYDRGRVVAEIEHSWEVQTARFDPAPWRERGLLDDEQVAALEAHLRNLGSPRLDDANRYGIARILGLEHFEQLPPKHLDATEAEFRKVHADLGDFVVVGEAFSGTMQLRFLESKNGGLP